MGAEEGKKVHFLLSGGPEHRFHGQVLPYPITLVITEFLYIVILEVGRLF